MAFDRARLADVDGLTYVDFALGDPRAMAGHSPAPTVAAMRATLGHVLTGGRSRT